MVLSSALQMKPLLICIQYTESIHFSIHYEHRNHPLSFTDWGKTKCEVQCGVSGDTAFKDAWRKSAAQIEFWWNNWMFSLQKKCSERSLQYIFLNQMCSESFPPRNTLHLHACANVIKSVCVRVFVRTHADERFCVWVGLGLSVLIE